MKINFELYVFLLIIIVGSIGFLLISYDNSNYTNPTITGQAIFSCSSGSPGLMPSGGGGCCASGCSITAACGSCPGCSPQYTCQPGLTCNFAPGMSFNGVCSGTAYRCGDNSVNLQGEECDGSDLQGQTCTSKGFSSGTLSCKSDCKFDTGSCTTQPVTCGNGRIDPGEECDYPDYTGADQVCINKGFAGGAVAQWLSCNNCQIPTGSCINWIRGTLTRMSLPLPQTSINEGATNVVIGKFIESLPGKKT